MQDFCCSDLSNFQINKEKSSEFITDQAGLGILSFFDRHLALA